MKEKLNIEKLFKDKFENFEANVNPNVWTNISQGIQPSAVSTTTGISFGVKAIITGAIATTIGVSSYFLSDFKTQNQQVKSQQELVTKKENKQNNLSDIKKVKTTPTIIAQGNDPVIEAHQDEIVKELTQNHPEIDREKEGNNPSNEIIVNDAVKTNINNKSQPHPLSNETTENKNDEVNDNHPTTVQKTTPKITKQESPTGKIEVQTTDNKFKYQFIANANNYEKIIWHFGDGESSNLLNPTHTYISAGEYEVVLMLISKDNELFEESKIIVIKAESSIDNIPNVITPNGDRINDEFVIKSTNIVEFNIVIKDKYDQVVFKSGDVNFAWDGNDKTGNRVENGVYIYYIFAKGSDGSIYKIPGQIYVQ